MEVRLGRFLDWDRYQPVLRRWWLPLLLGILVGAALGLVVSLWEPRAYKAQTYILINQVQTPGQPALSDVGLSQGAAGYYSQVVTSKPFLRETSRQLGLSANEEALLSANVTARALQGTQYLTISVTDRDPQRAAAIANRLAQTLVGRVQQSRSGNVEPVRAEIDRELDEARQRVTEASDLLQQLLARPDAGNQASAEVFRLQNQLELYRGVYLSLLDTQRRIRLEQLQAASAVSIVLPADVPTTPVPRDIAYNTARAGLIGLLLMLSLAVVIEVFDDRLRDREDLRRRFGLVPLGAFAAMPRSGARILADQVLPVGEGLIESARQLRTNLGFVTPGSPIVLCISSARRGEGATTVAANLALTEAEAGRRVILVDANLRAPSLHDLFALPNEHGLSTFLVQPHMPFPPPLHDAPGGVRVLVGGPVPPNPLELLGSQRMAELLDELRARADIVILDAAPILSSDGTLALQRAVGGIILVIDPQRTGARRLQQVLGLVQQASGTILGVVFNKEHGRQRGFRTGSGTRSGPGGREQAGRRGTIVVPAPRPIGVPERVETLGGGGRDD